MRFLKALWRKVRVTWFLWKNRREIERLTRLVQSNVQSKQGVHLDLLKPLNRNDAHFEHYEKMQESAPRPYFPPPDTDDGLN